MSKGILKYLLLFLGLVVFLAAYFFVYMDFSDKTDAVNKEIATLNSRLKVLEGYNSQLTEYRDSMEDNKERIGGILSRYYDVERPEDFIVFATSMEDEVGVAITTLSFTEPAHVHDIAGVTDNEKDTLPVQPVTLQAYIISSLMTGTMTYGQMKTALDFIYAQRDVTTLESLNVSYDSSTGLLLGDFIINKYFITGRDNVHHQLSIPYDDLGNSVLMGG